MSATAAMANGAAAHTVALTQSLIDQCYLPYDPDLAPTLRDCPVTTTSAASQAIADPSRGCIQLPAPLIEQACLLLARGLDSPRSADRLPVYAFCSPELDDSLAADSAVVYCAHALQSDLVVLNAEDLADGECGVLGKDLCSALWTLYASPDQAELGGYHADSDAFNDEDLDSDDPGQRLSGQASTRRSLHGTQAYDDAFARAVGFLEAVVGHMVPGSSAAGRRLLYLRNFGAMSFVIQPLVHALGTALDRCNLEVIVVAGIWPAAVVGSEGTSEQESEFAAAFRSNPELLSYLRKKFTPGQYALQDDENRFTSLADLFQAALMQHAGACRLKRRSRCSTATEFVFERAFPIFLEPGTSILQRDDSSASFVRFLIAEWNIRQLGVAAGHAGISLDTSPLNVKDWQKYSGLPSTGTPLRELTTQILSTSVLAELVGNIRDSLPASTSYAEILATIQRQEAMNAVLKSRIGHLLPNEKLSDVVEAAIAEMNETGTLDTDQTKVLRNLVIEPSAIDTRFGDVHIQPDIIEAIRSAISIPLKYRLSGILASESASGFLLYGPPGTGKTMLCRALAKESDLRFVQLRYGDVQSELAGESEKFVHIIFDFARRIGPCILFIDEVDALFARRGGLTYPYWAQTLLVEFMQEMDGLTTAASNRKNNLIIIGATNRPQDVDDAVLRRLPNRFLIDLPGKPEREKIIRHYLMQEKTDATVDIAMLVKRTKLYSGSDLKHLVLHAARTAFHDAIKADSHAGVDVLSQAALLRTPDVVISAQHFELALSRITASCRSNMWALRRVQRFGRSEDKPSVFARAKSLLQRRQVVPPPTVSAPGPIQRG